MYGTEIFSTVVKNFYFLDYLNFLPMSLKSMPKSFDFSCKKGYYPHFFNTAQYFDYVGPYPEPKFCWADYMSGDERTEFLEWCEEQDRIFCNKQ